MCQLIVGMDGLTKYRSMSFSSKGFQREQAPYQCRFSNGSQILVLANSDDAANKLAVQIESVAHGNDSKWISIVSCVRAGLRVPIYEKWLLEFKKIYFYRGGLVRCWPEVGMPLYDRSSTELRWHILESCGWWPEDSDPLSLVECCPSDVTSIAIEFEHLGLPESVVAEAILYATHFNSWEMDVDSRVPALVCKFKKMELIEHGRSSSPISFLNRVPFRQLSEFAKSMGLKPGRSIKTATEAIANSDTDIGSNLASFIDKHVETESFTRVSLPLNLSQRQLLSARAYARGLVCFLVDAMFDPRILPEPA
ncbi:MAG: hypothetical protein ABJA62_10990 [Luteimonas sp.]